MTASLLPPRADYLEDIRKSGLTEEEKEAIFRFDETAAKNPLTSEQFRAQIRRGEVERARARSRPERDKS